AVASSAALARAGDGANFAGRIHDAQGMAAALQDVDIALGIDGHGARIEQRRRAGHGAVFGHAALAVAGHGADDAAVELHDADPFVVEVGQVELFALGIEGDAVDAAELGLERRPAVAVEALLPRAGD